MTISEERAAEVRRLHFAEHWKVGTIASQLGMHPDAVKRVLGLTTRGKAISVGKRADRPSLLEPYKPFIEKTLEQHPRLRATRIYDMIGGRGYEGSARRLREYVAKVRPTSAKEAYLLLDPLPAEQAQIDWAHVGTIPVRGGTRPLWVFVQVMSYSRAMWAELVLEQTASSLRRSLVRAAEFFGGAPRQWLFDNPRSVVLERHGQAVRFHPILLDVAGAMCVAPRLCAPRKPNQKGKVERAIRFLKERFFAARTIATIAKGNEELLTFLHDIANSRPHPRLAQRTVADALAEERSRLLPLPSPLPATDVIEVVTVDKTAFIRFDTNLYSVPSAYATKTLTLVSNDTTLRLLEHGKEVAMHRRVWGRGERVERREHRQTTLRQKPGARDLKARDRLLAVAPKIDRLFERWLEDGHNVGSLVARASSLLDLYGDEILAKAVAEAIVRGTFDVGALAMLCETARKQAARPVSLPVPLGRHVPDRDVIPHDLGGYDE